MIILASQSPRRRELLTQLNVPFDILVADIDESARPGETPNALVTRLARQKTQTVWDKSGGIKPVLGSDTIVVLNQRVLGKPKDKADFIATMLALSGNTHEVMTAIALKTPTRMLSEVVTTRVSFKPLNQEEIAWYWRTGEPQDKAGGYGIQGLGGQFVSYIEGSYSAVVGLPLYQTAQMLQQAGVDTYER